MEMINYEPNFANSVGKHSKHYYTKYCIIIKIKFEYLQSFCTLIALVYVAFSYVYVADFYINFAYVYFELT